MNRAPKKTFLRIPHEFVVCAVAVILYISCDQDPTILTEYEGVNLIANKGFDSGDWVPDQGSTYMNFEEVAGVALPADVADSAVYRLEIRNLVEDGDFEQSTVGLAPVAAWSTSGITPDPADDEPVIEVAEISDFDGKCLDFDVPSPNKAVEFDLGSILDGYQQSKSYILRFDFKPDSEALYFYYFPTYDSDDYFTDLHTADAKEITVYDFPADFEITTSEFTSTGSADAFYITEAPQSGYIDNFRIVRTDIPLRIRITLPWADTGRPDELPLVSGWYEFSLWVRSDTVAADNRFESHDVTIGVENDIAVFPDRGTPLDMNGWARISMVAFVQIDAPEDPSEHVLELSVSSTDLKYANSRDVGSLLIAAPALELFSSDPR
jgi:hypothetical protein